MALLKDIAVSGEYVDQIKDKTFKVAKAPHYEQVPDMDNPEKMRERLIVPVELADKSILDYYPNRTSQKTMANLWGYDMDKWIGRKFEWTVVNQKVMGNQKKVLFVLEKRFNGKR